MPIILLGLCFLLLLAACLVVWCIFDSFWVGLIFSILPGEEVLMKLILGKEDSSQFSCRADTSHSAVELA